MFIRLSMLSNQVITFPESNLGLSQMAEPVTCLAIFNLFETVKDASFFLHSA